ncbi:hypothetical protein BP5796_06515 [Coleophoma crateriformis]|uniref:Uncharacterized protein n=1 Tax=Coleophoma crateriformis TaxID=565419 RepID=A0A3D8RP73_9HELO|nr:hypothetical protein BP5796_06515 [Coleophoma crateriformis]
MDNASSIMRNLLRQLIEQNEYAFEAIRREFRYKDCAMPKNSNSPYFLWKLLRRILCNWNERPLWFVLDALDECEDDSQEVLLDNITSLQEDAKASNIRWLLTSRNESSVERLLYTKSIQISLEYNKDSVAKDVEKYIDDRILGIYPNKNIPPKYINEIKTQLLLQAEGTFLWVALACRQLRTKAWHRAKEVLAAMPSGLDELYAVLLEKALNNGGNIVREILAAVLVAVRPLTLLELGLLAGLELGFRDDSAAVQSFAEECGSLVTIQDSRIHLVHTSVKEYLASNPETFGMAVDTGHAMMALRSFEYVCGGIFDQGPQILSFDEWVLCMPNFAKRVADEKVTNRGLDGLDHASLSTQPRLLGYPISFFLYHAQLSPHDFIDFVSSSIEFHRFFGPASVLLERWLQTIFCIHNASSPWDPAGMNTLHVAAMFGFNSLFDFWFNEPELPLESCDDHGRTPFYWASTMGQISFMEHLLGDFGADRYVEANDGSGTALHAAVNSKQEEVIAALLDADTDVDVLAGTPSQTVLFKAVQFNDEALVRRLLVQHKANPNIACGRTWVRPRLWADSLDCPEDRNGFVDPENAVTYPLHEAARRGYLSIVKLLLDYHASIELKDIPGGKTALHQATDYWHNDVVQTLLEHGANVNAISDTQDTALHVAMYSKNVSLVELFLEHGADIDAHGTLIGTVLAKAVSSKAYSWAGEFVDRGASVNARGADLTHVLITVINAAESGMIQGLLKAGADPNVRDTSQEPALTLAVRTHNLEIVELLLLHGADASVDDFGPLKSACSLGAARIVELLKENLQAKNLAFTMPKIDSKLPDTRDLPYALLPKHIRDRMRVSR